MYEKQDTSKKINLSWWPSPQDYQESIQSPQASFADHELRNGLIYVDAMGLPRPVTGAFASVYRVRCSSRDTALRCFLHNTSDQESRYQQISDYVQNDDLVYTVTFDYLQQGVQVAGSWFPALKMEWVDGLPLDVFITQNLHNPSVLEQLCEKFKQMMFDLESAGIAHGDLQHGNIIVLPDLELRLVDYDGMYVSSMQGMNSNELGHANYQHPQRQAHHFGSYLDNFAAWVIYSSIAAARIDPKLWHQLGAGDDCLLFRKSDFHAPLKSQAFFAFENHSHPHLRELGRFLRGQLDCSPETIPHLRSIVPAVNNLPRLTEPPAVRSAPLPKPRSATDLPEWIKPSEQEVKVHRIEPELSQPTPRPVREAGRGGRWFKASELQLLMLLNPFVWIMFLQLWLGLTINSDLTKHGTDIPGVVTDRSTCISSNGKPTVTVNYQWGGDKHGTPYTDSETFSPEGSRYLVAKRPIAVHALPSDPRVHEPLLSPPGTKQTSNVYSVLSLVLLNLIFELYIWLPAMTDIKLARSGRAALAVVAEARKIKHQVSSTNYIYNYNVTIEFEATIAGQKEKIRKVLKLDEHGFRQLREGDIVSVMYPPDAPHLAKICKLLSFQPVLKSSKPKGI